jgi:hypothetical protein
MMVYFLFATASRPALGPTQPPNQWVPGNITPGVKRPGREADHLTSSSAEVKNAWNCTSAPLICLHGARLVEHGDNFALIVLDLVTVNKQIFAYYTLKFQV